MLPRRPQRSDPHVQYSVGKVRSAAFERGTARSNPGSLPGAIVLGVLWVYLGRNSGIARFFARAVQCE